MNKLHRVACAASPLRTPAAQFVIIFSVLSFLFAFGQFHRSAGGVLSPVLNEGLGLSAAQLAIVTGALFLAQGLTQIPVGVLLDRFGPRRTIPAVAAIAAVGSCIFALSEGWIGLVIGRLLIGIGFAAVMMGAYVLFTRWVAPEKFSTVSGRFLFIGGSGGLLATTPLAFAIESIGWRSTFLWLGVATFVTCLITFATIRDAPATRSAAATPRAASLRESITGLREVLGNRAMWPILIVGLCLYSPSQILLGIWAGPFLRDIHGLGPLERSHVLLAMALAMNTGALLFGPLERWLNRRKRLVLASMATLALLFAALATAIYALPWLTIAVFIAISAIAPFFIVVIAHCQAMFAAELAGRAMACLNMVAITGVFVMQNVTGLVIEAVPHETGAGSLLGYRLVFATMAATFAAATVLYTWTTETKPRAARAASDRAD